MTRTGIFQIEKNIVQKKGTLDAIVEKVYQYKHRSAMTKRTINV